MPRQAVPAEVPTRNGQGAFSTSMTLCAARAELACTAGTVVAALTVATGWARNDVASVSAALPMKPAVRYVERVMTANLPVL